MWGTQGTVVATSLTSSTALQKITPGGSGSNSSLPSGVSASDVKMMFATAGTIAITTFDGYVYVLSQNDWIRQQTGNNTSWVKIQKSSNNDGTASAGDLTDIVATRGTPTGLMALDVNGNIYTWGYNTYRGSGNSANRNYATQMTKPSGIIKMIGVTSRGSSSNYSSGTMSYYLLMTNGSLYALGTNADRQLGDWSTTERTSWIQPRYSSSSGQVMNNIIWISPVEHDWYSPAINVVTNKDGGYKLFNWGAESGYFLGRNAQSATTSRTAVNPGVPTTFASESTPNVLTAETGGHTTVLVQLCNSNFGYIGHRINGSMGDGTTADQTQNPIQFNTNFLQVAGVPSITAKINITPNIIIQHNGNQAILKGDPPNGKFSIELGDSYATLKQVANQDTTITFGNPGGSTQFVRIRYTATMPSGSTCAVEYIDHLFELKPGTPVQITVKGNVWEDLNGDAIKNGTEDAISNGLYANVVDPNGNVITSNKVLPNGTYETVLPKELLNNINGDYKVILTNIEMDYGDNLTKGDAPKNNYVYTGTNTNNSDPKTNNTKGEVTIGNLNNYSSNTTVGDINFGIRKSELKITKTSDVSGNFEAGQTIEYTIVIENNDNVIHENVNVTDNLPYGTTYVSGSVDAELSDDQLPVVKQTKVTESGSGSIAIPAGVTSLTVETWGAGGRGGTRSNNGVGGGGGGGAYSKKVISNPTDGTYYYSVGEGSTSTSPGGNTWFNSSNSAPTSNATYAVLARGGSSVGDNSTNGANGGNTSGYGDTKYSGGNGANGIGNNAGGGGSSAGTGANGTNASNMTGASAPAGGGNGGDGTNTNNSNGNPGLFPGGGGGGARRSGSGATRNGGAGANGQIIITYNGFETISGDVDEPSNLATNWTILPGEKLTVTYKIKVDDPSSLSSITNIASVKSNFITTPLKDTAIDYTNTTHAINDENSTWVNTPVSGDVTTNDFDVEGNDQTFSSFLKQDDLSTSISNGATVKGTAIDGTPVADAGKLNFNSSDGTYTYEPADGFVGNISVPYQICDNGTPTACAIAYLDITVSPVPSSDINTSNNSVIANNDEFYALEGNPINKNVFGNDNDPQGHDFEITSYKYDSDGDGTLDQEVDGTDIGTPHTIGGFDENGLWVNNAGILTQNEDGEMEFTPSDGFSGTVTYYYTITDEPNDASIDEAEDLAKVVITILRDKNGVDNDPPIPGDDFAYTKVNTPVEGSFIDNDTELNDDPMSVGGVTIDPSKTILVEIPAYKEVSTEKDGTITLYDNGTYEYTPPADYVGPDYFVYEVCDVTTVNPQPLCAEATIHMLVSGVSLSGTVYNDIDGSTNNNVSTNYDDNTSSNVANDGTNAGGIFAILTDKDDKVVASTAVNSDGTYRFDNIPSGDYQIILSEDDKNPGDNITSSLLPEGWASTGEYIGAGTGNDGDSNAILKVKVEDVDIDNINFGIEKLPETVENKIEDSGVYDSGDGIIVPEKAFIEDLVHTTNPKTEDYDGGVVRKIRFTEFPSNINKIKIGSNEYTSSTWPTDGVIVDYDPTNGVTIGVEVFPKDVINEVNIPIASIDNAGKEDPTPGFINLGIINPLPVELINFEANKSGNTALITWTTVFEQNNFGFEVQHSTDGGVWSEIDFVNSKAEGQTSYGIINYQHIHSNPNKGINYYRLKQVDYNGDFEYSPIRSVIFNGLTQQDIVVFPNPTSSELNINGLSGNEIIKVYDNIGRLVAEEVSNASTTTLNISNFENGVYFINIIDQNGFINSFSIVKE